MKQFTLSYAILWRNKFYIRNVIEGLIAGAVGSFFMQKKGSMAFVEKDKKVVCQLLEKLDVLFSHFAVY